MRYKKGIHIESNAEIRYKSNQKVYYQEYLSMKN